jgi:hypothetical protein
MINGSLGSLEEEATKEIPATGRGPSIEPASVVMMQKLMCVDGTVFFLMGAECNVMNRLVGAVNTFTNLRIQECNVDSAMTIAALRSAEGGE